MRPISFHYRLERRFKSSMESAFSASTFSFVQLCLYLATCVLDTSARAYLAFESEHESHQIRPPIAVSGEG